MATYQTVEQINARNQAIAAAEAKAASTPAELTDEDLAVLPGETTARLMASGQLAHLGIGACRKPRRHG